MFESLFAAAVLGAAGPLAAQTPTAPPPRAVAAEVQGFPLRHVAAADAAVAVADALRADGRASVTTTDPATNVLFVQGSPAARLRAIEFVAALDREPATVRVDDTVARVPAEFVRDCGLARPGESFCWTLSERETALFRAALRHAPGREVLAEPQLRVRDNQTGYLQVGADVPFGPRGEPRPAGVGARVTPRLTPDGKVLLRLETQVSHLNRTPTQGPAAFPFNEQTTQTTALLPAGETLVVSLPVDGEDGKPATVLYVVTPTVRP